MCEDQEEDGVVFGRWVGERREGEGERGRGTNNRVKGSSDA